MSSPASKDAICTICGSRREMTATGDLGCLPCLLRTGLEEEPSSWDSLGSAVPEAFGTYVIARREDGTLHELGRGAMGVTFLAEDTSLQRQVALKIIAADFASSNPDARERFVCEARAAAALRHPNVATVYQFGVEEETGQYFCAMELVEGETLEQRVRRTGPLEVRATLAVARQVTDALLVAESCGLVHRDLKPANIMMVKPDERGEVVAKVIDFGVAKALQETPDRRHLTHGNFIGTPAFASPEQLQGDTVDVRSDIYSLGATLWYALTGCHIESKDGRPSALRVAQLKSVQVPTRIISLLQAMLMTEPAARPSVEELAARLKAIEKNRAQPILIGLAGLVTVVALAFGYYFYVSPAPPQRDAVSFGKSVAVLPFDDLSEKQNHSTFADGVQDELLTNLARIADLKVVSRTSVMQYARGQHRSLREIGRQLGVAYIVEGTVHQLGDKVRVSAQLIDARSDLHQWSQSYDRPLGDVFAIQSEIAQTIAAQLGAVIAPHEKAAINAQPTHDLAAFDLYTRAKSLLEKTSFSPRGKDNLFQAAQLLQKAVTRDPKFLLAYCQLAAAHDVLYFLGFDHTPKRLSLAEAAIKAATELGPGSGEAHLARARHLYQGYLAYEPALAELEIARNALPNQSSVFSLAGYIYRREGKWDESARQFENALSLDPRNFYTLQQLSISYNLLRRYPDAAKLLDRALTIVPHDVDTLLSRAAVDLNWRADTRPLHAIIAAILAKKPSAGPDLAGVWIFLAFCEHDQEATARAVAALGDGTFGPGAFQFRRTFWEGLAARVRGDAAEAKEAFLRARAEQERIVAAQENFAPAICILGLIDAGLGRKADAIREGRRAVELLPVSRDPINGVHIMEYLGSIYAWSGETELACEQLEKVSKIPGNLSYGQLRLSPLWDDLRGNPRFEKLVASLAPAAGK
ncbi:MAG: protein kinase domain-containing protein [Chthoniobacterales bacterium]